MRVLAHAKSVRADLAKHEITISFTLDLDEQTMQVAEELSGFAHPDSGAVDLTILPRQMPMFERSKPKDGPP